jgi:hypothetical protein
LITIPLCAQDELPGDLVNSIFVSRESGIYRTDKFFTEFIPDTIYDRFQKVDSDGFIVTFESPRLWYRVHPIDGRVTDTLLFDIETYFVCGMGRGRYLIQQWPNDSTQLLFGYHLDTDNYSFIKQYDLGTPANNTAWSRLFNAFYDSFNEVIYHDSNDHIERISILDGSTTEIKVSGNYLNIWSDVQGNLYALEKNEYYLDEKPEDETVLIYQEGEDSGEFIRFVEFKNKWTTEDLIQVTQQGNTFQFYGQSVFTIYNGNIRFKIDPQILDTRSSDMNESLDVMIKNYGEDSIKIQSATFSPEQSGFEIIETLPIVISSHDSIILNIERRGIRSNASGSVFIEFRINDLIDKVLIRYASSGSEEDEDNNGNEEDNNEQDNTEEVLSSKRTEVLTVYPNPGSSHFTFQSPIPIRIIEIISLDGRLVFRKQNINKSLYTYHSQLTKGIYIARVYTDNFDHSVKVIINP